MNTKFKPILVGESLSPGCIFALDRGTAFTDQRRLNDGANPAGGSYDFGFALSYAAANRAQPGNLLLKSATPCEP